MSILVAKKLYMPLSTLSIRLRPEGLILLQWSRVIYQSEESIQESPTLQNSFASRCPYFSYWIWITAKRGNLHNHSRYWISPAPTPSEKPPFQPEVTYYPVAQSGKTLSGKGGRGRMLWKMFSWPCLGLVWKQRGAGATLPPLTPSLVLYHD